MSQIVEAKTIHEQEKEKRILEEVSDFLLNHQKIVFLFGAGTSISSGMPGSGILKQDLWMNKLKLRPWKDVRDLLKEIGITLGADIESENINLEQITFEQLMTVACSLETGATQEEKEREIAKWLENQIPDIYTSEIKYFPSLAYEFICHLMSNDLVEYVVSMNYDEILDKAIDDELGKGRCLRVVTLEDFELLSNTDNLEKIADSFLIKPHGTRSMRRSCRYRIEHVQRFEEDKRRVLEKVLDDSVLVIVGYGASDNDFRNLLGDLGLNKIQKILVVNKYLEKPIKNLGGPNNKIYGYEGRDDEFFKQLADILYGDESNFKERYNKFYTKATRHFIRALVYRQINPTNETKKRAQEMSRQKASLFFEKLNLLIEILIYCFKVRGLFTRRALSSCSRITSALDDYLAKAEENENPIENLLQELEEKDILKSKKIDAFESWYYIPVMEDKNAQDLFRNAAEQDTEFLAEKLNEFFDTDDEKNEFVTQITDWLAHLPSDFDYDLLKGLSFYFLPLKNIERITRREQFREKTEEILEMARKREFGTLYVMSTSVAEWLWKWGQSLAGQDTDIKIIINRDVYEIKDSLHYKHIFNTVECLRKLANVKDLNGVRYGLTLTFHELEEGITGKAILFLREGKASAFAPIFIEEKKAIKEQSDINKLKIFFEKMFNKSGKEL